MLKLTFCLIRLPHLTRSEFQTYWRGTHADLVMGVREPLRIRRYVQAHSLPHEDSLAIRKTRGAPAEFDGVAELWWDSIADMNLSVGDPEAAKAARTLLEDERTFIDLEKSPLWWTEEHEIF